MTVDYPQGLFVPVSRWSLSPFQPTRLLLSLILYSSLGKVNCVVGSILHSGQRVTVPARQLGGFFSNSTWAQNIKQLS
jgi:hypothetical protein